MFETKEGMVWSGEAIHSECDKERHDATLLKLVSIKRGKRMDRLYKMLN